MGEAVHAIPRTMEVVLDRTEAVSQRRDCGKLERSESVRLQALKRSLTRFNLHSRTQNSGW